MWGIGLQFVVALVILRTAWGYAAFDWLGKRITEFLVHVDAGSIFIFGEKYTDHFFAFKVSRHIPDTSEMFVVMTLVKSGNIDDGVYKKQNKHDT